MAPIDILIILIITVGVSFVGHHYGRGIADRTGFFNAGRSLPWWAVSASIAATVVSSVTYVSVPAKVFKESGNLLYVQMILGLMLGKVVTAWLFAKPYYHSTGVDTTYDYIRLRMDRHVGNLSMFTGIVLDLLNMSVKLLTIGLVLSVITEWSLSTCCLAVVVFSVFWSWLAGLKTVILTDLLLFIIFSAGALCALLWTGLAIDMPLVEAFRVLDEKAKLALFDLSVDPKVTYTLWACIVGAVTLNIALASNQTVFQRVRACRSARDASKAYIYSALFYFVHFILIGTGLALSVFYYENPLSPLIQEEIQNTPDRIFTHFIVNDIPAGLSGFLIAGIFAAGISTLDTSLTGVSDITVSNIYERYIKRNASEQHYLWVSRIVLIIWGGLFYLGAISLNEMQGYDLLDMTFMLPNFVSGILLGTVVLARYRVGHFSTYVWGVLAAVVSTKLMHDANVSFFWWCPASGLILIMVTCLLAKWRSEFNPEFSGIVNAGS